MHTIDRKSLETLIRFQRQAQRLATSNVKHATLAIFLAGYLKTLGVTL